MLRDKRQRPGRNPQTGDPIKISERRVLTFKASQILKQALNAKEKEKNGGGAPHPGTPGTAPVTSGARDGASAVSSSSSGMGGGGSGLSGGSSGMNVPLTAAAVSESPKE